LTAYVFLQFSPSVQDKSKNKSAQQKIEELLLTTYAYLFKKHEFNPHRWVTSYCSGWLKYN